MTLSRPTIIEWDGANLPPELSALPPGRYLVEPADQSGEELSWEEVLTPDQEAGLRLAIEELETGGGIPFEEVRRDFERRWAQR